MARDATTTTPDTRIGNWSELEQSQFANGIIAKGWGHWSSMAGCIIPTRDRSQIKSHAQKFLRSYPDEVDWLVLQHNKYAAMATNAAAAAEGGDGGGMPKRRGSKKSSSSPPRRRASMIKAKTPALARSNSPRQARRFSAPGSIGFVGRSSNSYSKIYTTPARRLSLRKKNTMMPSSSSPTAAAPAPAAPTAAAAAPSLSSPPSTPDSILSGVISDMYRTTLESGAPSPSISAHLSEFLSPTTTTPHRSPHMSVKNEDIASNDDSLNKDDELAILAAAITFSSDPLSASFDKLVNDALELPLFAGRNDEISDTSNAENSINSILFTDQNGVPLDGKDDAVIDPLLCMKFEERDLGMVFDFVGTSSRNAIVLATNNEQNDLAMTHYIDIARPSPHISKHIRSMLIAPTDYNNPTEYFLAADGVSRTGLHRGAVCRARIKKLLGEHFDYAWWKDDGFADHIPTSDSNVGLIQSALDAYCALGSLDSFAEVVVVGGGEAGMFKTFAFESFVALAAAMLYGNNWYTPMDGDPRTFAKDVEDIRYVGNLIHDLWECVNPSLRRDGALQHDADNLEAATGRNAAISSIVDRLKLISRLEHIHATE